MVRKRRPPPLLEHSQAADGIAIEEHLVVKENPSECLAVEFDDSRGARRDAQAADGGSIPCEVGVYGTGSSIFARAAEPGTIASGVRV